MLAYVYKDYGSPDVLAKIELPTPSPGPTEVLIKIHATTVSAADWRARSLTMPAGLGWLGRLVFGVSGPRRPVLGTEFAGVIAQAGEDVARFQVGDAVIGYPGGAFGAHAEFIIMSAEGELAYKPADISFEEAAAIPFGATTAYDFLINKAGLKAGERVLINGAAGSTGSACVQLAKHFGAHVTAVCSAANADLMRSIGADCVIDYRTQDFAKAAVRYDMIVDTVATAPWSRSKKVLRPHGRMVMIAGKTSDMLFGRIKASFGNKRFVGGVASESREILETVVRLAADGAFRPIVDGTYDFDQMADAHRRVDTGHKIGNVVVRVAGSRVQLSQAS